MSQHGAGNANWKGGRVRGGDKGRYWLVHRPDHPSASSIGYVLEHRIVMEAHLGRYLRKGEVVHHRNGDPADNRIENLELMASQADHARHHLAERLVPLAYRRSCPVVTKICEHCETPFECRTRAQAARRFCSRPCYWQYRHVVGGQLQKGAMA